MITVAGERNCVARDTGIRSERWRYDFQETVHARASAMNIDPAMLSFRRLSLKLLLKFPLFELVSAIDNKPANVWEFL